MNVSEMINNWNGWGEQDPLYAVLGDPSKKDNQWDEADFFETGQKKVNFDISNLKKSNIDIITAQALDFGCGVGRLTNALANHFDKVHGIDISKSMIDKANEYNRFPEKVSFIHNEKGNLEDFKDESYSFIYSQICLHHIPTKFQKLYIADFLRLLQPGGLALFQTSHTYSWRKLIPNVVIDSYRRMKNKRNLFIPCYGISINTIRSLCKQHECNLLQHSTCRDPFGGNRYIHDVYCIEKPLSQA